MSHVVRLGPLRPVRRPVKARRFGAAVGLSAFAALLLFSFSASGARMAAQAEVVPLRTERESKGWRNRFQMAGAQARASGAGIEVRIAKAARPPALGRRFLRVMAMAAPGARPPGAYAHTGSPMRDRWASLGGHGRHGAG